MGVSGRRVEARPCGAILDLMEMHQVRYFLAAARLLNFTRAASECDVTQPSLTRAIQKLEEEFGGPLFRRERSRTHLTELGRLVLPSLRASFEAAVEAKELARDAARAELSPLALGVATIIPAETVQEIVTDLGRGLAGFELKLVTGSTSELVEMARAGSLDLLVVEMPEAAPDRFEAWDLFSHRYHLLVSKHHPLAKLGTIKLEQASAEDWIECGSENRKRLQDAASLRGFDPHIRHSVGAREHVDPLVASGFGVALLPPRTGQQLSAIAIEDIDLSADVVVAAVAGRKRSTASNAFVRAARARGWPSAQANDATQSITSAGSARTRKSGSTNA